MVSEFDCLHPTHCLASGLGMKGKELKDKHIEVIQAVCTYVSYMYITGYMESLCYQCVPFLFDHKLRRVDLPPSKWSVCLVVLLPTMLHINSKHQYRTVLLLLVRVVLYTRTLYMYIHYCIHVSHCINEAFYSTYDIQIHSGGYRGF